MSVLGISLAVGGAGTAVAGYYLSRIYRFNVLPRYSTDWEMRLYPPELDMHGRTLGPYYGDFRKCLHDYDFDEDGIIVLVGGEGEARVRNHNPCQIAEMAIIEYENDLQTGDERHRESFRRHVEWLARHATPLEGGKACFYYEYDTPEEKAPWGSGLAQGMAISALLRAHELFGEPRYFQLARQAFALMDAPVEEGGFRHSDPEFVLWYEEDNHRSHILNGHIYSLLAVHDLFRVTGDSYYRECFERGTEAIKRTIGRFDTGYLTKYQSVDDFPANNSYHYIHITLFEILHRLTADPFFGECARRFAAYHGKPLYKVPAFLAILKGVLRDRLPWYPGRAAVSAPASAGSLGNT